MIRVFGEDANKNHERCSADTYYQDEDLCYLCRKYAAGLTTPLVTTSENGEERDSEVTELYHMDTKQVYYKKENENG
jgi:hypothetical protein